MASELPVLQHPMSRLPDERFLGARQILGRLRDLASIDAFPEFSAKVRRLFYNPMGVLILAAFAALMCGLFLHPQGFVLFGGISAVLLLGIAWPWLCLRGMNGSISFEQSRACEGERVEVRLTLRNSLPWSAWGLAVRDGFATNTAPKDDATPVASIASAPRRRTIRCRWYVVLPCRGVYPLVPPRLTTGFPFGLWEKSRAVTTESPLIVWPRTFPVGPVPFVSGDQQVDGNVSRNKVGSNGDVLGVRPYRRGDSPRRIHWGQSARHDRLIVCELQSNARPVIQLVLDAHPSIHAGARNRRLAGMGDPDRGEPGERMAGSRCPGGSCLEWQGHSSGCRSATPGAAARCSGQPLGSTWSHACRNAGQPRLSWLPRRTASRRNDRHRPGPAGPALSFGCATALGDSARSRFRQVAGNRAIDNSSPASATLDGD